MAVRLSSQSDATPLARPFALPPIVAIQAMELLTGIGLTLLGSMLPAVAALWHLDDAHSGRLLLAVFAGSALGALLVRPPFHRALAAGMAMFAVSVAGLAVSQGGLLFLIFLLFGTGLGLAMTANSLLTGSRYGQRRAAMLTLLNFSWSAGAALCPIATSAVLHHSGVRAVFWSVAALSAASVLLALLLRDGEAGMAETTPSVMKISAERSSRVIVFFSIFGMLYCGTEASLGSWMLTYVHRLHFQASEAPPLAASCFWLALLIGRAVAPAVLLRVREEKLLFASLLCAVAGVVALLTLQPLPAVMLAAALTGFSLAPVFPICVSIFLALAGDATQARWMFAVAGVGSATLPWATGQIAAHTGSLHTGLFVPLLATCAMFAMLRWPGGGTELFRTTLASRLHPRADCIP